MKQLLVAALGALLASPALADTLIDNANGIQVGAEGTIQRFEALLVGDDGKVVRTFRSGEPRPVDVDERVDMHGRTLLPGLIDAHGHVMGLGQAALRLDLVGIGSLAELQQRLRDYAAANPGPSWIVGRGWNQELCPE